MNGEVISINAILITIVIGIATAVISFLFIRAIKHISDMGLKIESAFTKLATIERDVLEIRADLVEAKTERKDMKATAEREREATEAAFLELHKCIEKGEKP